jgi:hypothetical protein
MQKRSSLHSAPKKPTVAAARDRVQGEGDYAAARRYRQSVETFVRTADVEQAARDAAPRSETERRDMATAEWACRRRAKRSPQTSDKN